MFSKMLCESLSNDCLQCTGRGCWWYIGPDSLQPRCVIYNDLTQYSVLATPSTQEFCPPSPTSSSTTSPIYEGLVVNQQVSDHRLDSLSIAVWLFAGILLTYLAGRCMTWFCCSSKPNSPAKILQEAARRFTGKAQAVPLPGQRRRATIAAISMRELEEDLAAAVETVESGIGGIPTLLGESAVNLGDVGSQDPLEPVAGGSGNALLLSGLTGNVEMGDHLLGTEMDVIVVERGRREANKEGEGIRKRSTSRGRRTRNAEDLPPVRRSSRSRKRPDFYVPRI